MLFTFEELETGELRDTLAPNEAPARLQLGGKWIDIERTAAFEPCEVAGLPEIYREAQAAEQTAHREMMAANPMSQGITTPGSAGQVQRRSGKSTTNFKPGARS